MPVATCFKKGEKYNHFSQFLSKYVHHVQNVLVIPTNNHHKLLFYFNALKIILVLNLSHPPPFPKSTMYYTSILCIAVHPPTLIYKLGLQ
jgi:hypothetical protein